MTFFEVKTELVFGVIRKARLKAERIANAGLMYSVNWYPVRDLAAILCASIKKLKTREPDQCRYRPRFGKSGYSLRN